MTSSVVYRFWDAEDRLLYIGMTSVGPARWTEHEANRPWWSSVARGTVEHFPDRASAMVAEKAAIQAEQPLHNTVHMVTREPRTRLKGRHGTGTVIERDDGRWAFVAWIDRRRRWFNVHTEAEARLLQACFTNRAAAKATRDKAIALLEELP